MILCKNCIHCAPAYEMSIFSRLKWEYAKCLRTAKVSDADISPVDGKIRHKERIYVVSCKLERMSESMRRCGKEATYFEAKK